MRSESLDRLERELSSLGRRDVICTEGKLSKGRLAYSKGKAKVEIGLLGEAFSDFVSSIFHNTLVVHFYIHKHY